MCDAMCGQVPQEFGEVGRAISGAECAHGAAGRDGWYDQELMREGLRVLRGRVYNMEGLGSNVAGAKREIWALHGVRGGWIACYISTFDVCAVLHLHTNTIATF